MQRRIVGWKFRSAGAGRKKVQPMFGVGRGSQRPGLPHLVPDEDLERTVEGLMNLYGVAETPEESG